MSQIDLFIELQIAKNNKKHQQLLYFSNHVAINDLKLYRIMELAQEYKLSPKYAFDFKRIAVESIKEGLQLNQQRYRLGFFNLSDPTELPSKITYSQLSLNSKYQVSHIEFSPNLGFMAFEAVYQGKNNREIHINKLERIKGTHNFKEIPLIGISLNQDLNAISPRMISHQQCLFLQEIQNNIWEISSCWFLEAGHSADATKGRLNSARFETITENAYVCQLYEPYYQKSNKNVVWVGWHENGGVAFFRTSIEGKKQKRIQCSGIFESFKNIIFDDVHEKIYFMGKKGDDCSLFVLDLNFNQKEIQLLDRTFDFEHDFVGICGALGEQILFVLNQKQLDLNEFDSMDSTQMTNGISELDDEGNWEKILDVFELSTLTQLDQIKLELEGKIVNIDSPSQAILSQKPNELYRFTVLQSYEIDEWHTQSQSKTMELGALSADMPFDDADESFVSVDMSASSFEDMADATTKYRGVQLSDIQPQYVQKPIFSQVNTLVDFQHPIDQDFPKEDFDEADQTQMESSSKTSNQQPLIDTQQIQMIKKQIQQVDPLEIMLTEHFHDWLQMTVASSDPLEELKKLSIYKEKTAVKQACFALLKQFIEFRTQEQSYLFIFMISAVYYLNDFQSIELLFKEYQKQSIKNNSSLFESIEYYFILMILISHLNPETYQFEPSKIFEEYQSTIDQIDELFANNYISQALQLKKQVEDYQRELWQNIELLFRNHQHIEIKNSISLIQGISPLANHQHQQKIEEHQADFISRIQQSSSSINLNLLFEDAKPVTHAEAVQHAQIQFQAPIQQPIIQQPVIQQPVIQQPVIQQPIIQQPIIQQVSQEQELLMNFPYWLSLAMQSEDPIARIRSLENFQTNPQIQEYAIQHLKHLILSGGDANEKSYALMFSISACVFLDAEGAVPLCYDWYRSVFLQHKPEIYESIEYYFALNLLLYLLNISTTFDPSQIYDEFQSTLGQIEGLFEQGMVDHAIAIKQSLQKHQKELWLTIENKYQKSQVVPKMNVSLVQAVSPLREPLKTEPFYSSHQFAKALQANSMQLRLSDLEEIENQKAKQANKPKTIAFQFNPFDEEESVDEEVNDQDDDTENPIQSHPSFFQNSMSVLQSSFQFYDANELQTPRFLKNFLLVQVLFALIHIFLSMYLGLAITIVNLLLLLSALALYQGKSWAYYLSLFSYVLYPFMTYSKVTSREFVKTGMRGPIWYVLILIAMILLFSLFNEKIKKFVFKQPNY